MKNSKVCYSLKNQRGILVNVLEIPHGSRRPPAVGTVISIDLHVPVPNASASIFSSTMEENPGEWQLNTTEKGLL